MAGIERFILTSAPLQDFFMELRRVAHWKIPPESAAYMVTYFVLLYYNLIMSTGVSSSSSERKHLGLRLPLYKCSTNHYQLLVAFTLVLKRRYYPPTIPDMRENLERSEDKDATAADLPQFIEQHGGHGWVDAMIEKAGPAIQLQVEDVADVLEVLLK
jgi:hypothetical protein